MDVRQKISEDHGLRHNAKLLNSLCRCYYNPMSIVRKIALDEAVRQGRVKKGDLVLLTSFGGGLTWGAILMRWAI